MYRTGASMNNLVSYCGLVDAKIRPSTVPIAEILSGKNGRAWVSMVLYLKKKKIKLLKQERNPGSPLEVAC
jgi:hypothetical protein